MNSMSVVFIALRRKNKRNYALLFGCLIFSALLITAYCLMMRSPTVLNTLPEGGDSRKQVMMIFVLAVIGCGALRCMQQDCSFGTNPERSESFLYWVLPNKRSSDSSVGKWAVSPYLPVRWG